MSAAAPTSIVKVSSWMIQIILREPVYELLRYMLTAPLVYATKWRWGFVQILRTRKTKCKNAPSWSLNLRILYAPIIDRAVNVNVDLCYRIVRVWYSKTIYKVKKFYSCPFIFYVVLQIGYNENIFCGYSNTNYYILL